MLYDRNHMQPLFALAIGNPGSSFAVEIARKIGLPEDVIDDASENVGSDYINMDKYLQDISRDKRYWERKRDEIRKERKRMEELSAKYESDIDGIKQQKKDILELARAEADKLIAESNARIENTIKEIRESQADKERTKEIRQSLKNFHESIHSSTAEVLKSKHKKNVLNKKVQSPINKDVSPLLVGDSVRMRGQTTVGELLELHAKKAVVAFGVIKSTVDINKLERVSKNQIRKESRANATMSNTRDLIHEKKLNFKQDIDVRGMRGDEALQTVMYFIDDAIQLGVTRVRILHGTGTGALRQIIRDYLSTVNGVAHFADEHVQFTF
jgi:DNA mismatch repair protein MutS2